jgi:HEPN domain-containing protein
VLDRDEFTRWRSEADRALQSARVQATARLHNWACFAAEQAAQLAVKALLHRLGKAPWGHDLVRLAERVRELAKEGWPAAIDVHVRRLSRHYIPARHPDAHPSGPAAAHYGPEDAEEAVADARRVLEAVDAIGVRLEGTQAGA